MIDKGSSELTHRERELVREHQTMTENMEDYFDKGYPLAATIAVVEVIHIVFAALYAGGEMPIFFDAWLVVGKAIVVVVVVLFVAIVTFVALAVVLGYIRTDFRRDIDEWSDR